MDIFSQETIIFLQIILVNVILSGDNAIVIGMVASQFEGSLRKKNIILWNSCGCCHEISFYSNCNFFTSV